MLLSLSWQTTASEATFVSLLAARTEAIQRYQQDYPDLEDAEINSRLVAYCSDQVTDEKKWKKSDVQRKCWTKEKIQ